MRINQNEIVDDVEAHIRQFGGDYSEWCVGTARDSASFRQHLAASLGDGLIYREAYTSYAADGVIERLVSGYGLRPDRASAPGSFVFVYRHTVSKPAEQPAAHSVGV
jgi:hypothetical protein